MKILFEFILVLALATKQTKYGRLRASDFVDIVVAHSTPENIKEKWLNEEDIGRVRRRLRRLTQDETQMTVAYNMEVVYGLISNIKILMDGARRSLAQLRRVKSLFRWQGIYRQDSSGSQCGRPLFHCLYTDECASHHSSDGSLREQNATFVILLRSRCGLFNVLSGDQILGVFRQWLSPPEPTINHKTARRILFSGTTKWFTENVRYKEWKATGSLLWVHGKCMCL